jgi:dTDP-4-amino-4,6-dideoxygalactose transaminase
MRRIPFNKPFLHGRELIYIAEAVSSGKISGDGIFSKKCQNFFETRYKWPKTLMTTSCTDALEMAAILLNIKDGDEVIVPSFTFVSTANAFVLRGAKIVFVDSMPDHPNLDVAEVEKLITPRTRAIVVVHYAGIACDLDPLIVLCNRYGIKLVEDNAHGIDSTYKDRYLGTFGAMSTLSFHETKNVSAGEGGMLVLNDLDFVERAEIIREKGTNRSAFFRGEVAKYNWVDIGSSFLPSDIVSAYLYAQLEVIDTIQAQRIRLWKNYWDRLSPIADELNLRLPVIPEFAKNNGHMFYIECVDLNMRTQLIAGLKQDGIGAVFHYQPLHQSPYFELKHDDRRLPHSERFADTLLRLPLFYELSDNEQDYICEKVILNLQEIRRRNAA